MLGIRELADFHLQDAHADFHVSGEKVHVDQLILGAPDLQLGAKGTIRFDQKISLDAQLSAADQTVKQLPRMVSESFSTDENGRQKIDFNIYGTTSRPKTNLMERLIGHKFDVQLGGLLELFGKKDDGKKKRDEEKEKDKRKKEKDKDKEKQAQKNPSTPEPARPASPASPATEVRPVIPESPLPPPAQPAAPAPSPSSPEPAAPPVPVPS